MKRILQIALSASLLVLATLSGCSKKDSLERAVSFDTDDAEMAAAIAKARDTLPLFWQKLAKPEHGENGFSLKVRITDKRGTEHFWAVDIERRDGKIFGTIDNDPDVVANVKLGDRIEIPEADISDWTYMQDGKMVGNETLRPLLKTLPPKDAERLKGMMADP